MNLFLQSSGDVVRVPADSGFGSVWRPVLRPASEGARLSGPESLYDFWLDVVYDPDSAIGRDPTFRDKLFRHPDVDACLRMREQAVLSMQDAFAAPDTAVNKAGAEAAAAYVNRVWKQVKDRDLIYQDMQSAILLGGAGHEWMWHREADGVQRPTEASPLDKSRVVFDRQKNMALRTRQTPVWGSYIRQVSQGVGGGDDRIVPNSLVRGKFTYHLYRWGKATWEQPELEGYYYYGRGEDVVLYDVVVRDFAVWLQEYLWLEQYGNPPRHLYVPPNNSDWNNWAQQIAEDLMTKKIVPIPSRFEAAGAGKRAFEVDQPDVPHAGFDAFGKSRERNTKSIEKILLMNAGVMDHGSKGGYADHVSRQENGPDVLAKSDSRRIAATINGQLVPSIIAFGPPQFRNMPASDLPVLAFTRQKEDEPAQVVDMFEKASKMMPVSAKQLRERSGLRAPDPNEPNDEIFTGQIMDEFGNMEGEEGFGEGGGEGEKVPGDRRKPLGQDDGTQSSDHDDDDQS